MHGSVVSPTSQAAGRLPYRAEDTSPSTGERWMDRLRRWLERLKGKPGLLRAIGRLRRWKATLPAGKQLLVLRHRDVIEVLTRDQDFTIAEINAARIHRVGGAFILAMDRSPQYDREAKALGSAVMQGDLNQIRQIVRTTAGGLLEAARPHGRLDVAGGYSRVIAARVVAEFFGVPGPEERILMQWMRSLFWDIFQNDGDDPLVRRAADFSAVELRDYLNRLIAECKNSTSESSSGNNVLTRLIRAGSLDDDGVRRNILGAIVGTLDNTVTSTAYAVDELLSRPEALRVAQKAAQGGDDDLLRHCCYEALRFRPPLPGLKRYSQRKTTLQSGTTIPAQVVVVPLTISAMFDPEAEPFRRPKEFLVDRPIDQYLYFGYGMHACLGREINKVLIPELVGTLLREPNIRRAPGRDGRIVYEGPYPDRLIIQFG